MSDNTNMEFVLIGVVIGLMIARTIISVNEIVHNKIKRDKNNEQQNKNSR